MRLLRLLTAGAVIGGAVVFLKRLLEGQEHAPGASSGSASGSSASGSSSRGSASADGSSASANGAEPTKAELYERAQELGIEGRSKMSKQQLKRAIESAG